MKTIEELAIELEKKFQIAPKLGRRMLRYIQAAWQGPTISRTCSKWSSFDEWRADQPEGVSACDAWTFGRKVWAGAQSAIPEGMGMVPIELLKYLDGERLTNGYVIYLAKYIAEAQGDKK